MRVAGIDALGGTLANQLGALAAVFLRNQFADWCFVKVHIGIKLGAIFKRQFFCFHHQVDAFRAVKTEGGQIKVLEYLQHL